MIRTEALSKRYGPRSGAVTAVRDVTLDIEPGVWGVVGPNGAGKTTLLGLILGFLHPTSGAVAVDDRPARQYLRDHGASYLPERFHLPGPWSVRSSLRALARLDGLPAHEADDRAEAAMGRLGLQEHAHRPVGDLSKGLTQRVGLAQALLSDRSLVVLDEPGEGLDPLWRVRLREIVADLRGDGRTILLASHDLAEVERLADRVVLLDDGRVREILDVRQPAGGPLRYRLSVVADRSEITDAVRATFPGALPESAEREPVEPGGPGLSPGGPGAPDGPVSWRDFVVSVADPVELSHRLAALLDTGATLRAVTPLTDDLETRVRRRLEEQ